LDRANECARREPEAFWDWFLTLGAEARTNGSLLANVLRSWRGTAPVPKRAFATMLRAAVEERDPSFNRLYVEPCVRGYGRRATVEALLRFLEEGTTRDKAGAANALYWTRLGDDELGNLREQLDKTLLHEFIKTKDLDVRRAILGQLSLSAEDYPSDERPLIPEAIEIARRSDDAYLRHRVEVQLGQGGPFMSLPRQRP
jgi:hypothetical protein